MSKRKRRHPRNRRLELTFYQLLSRLNDCERERVSAELAQPFRRHWFVVDGRGLRRLEE
jgi:hypothetical protein